ncbi:MAG: hypothetical protein AB7O48_09810 [Cyclobacteriaceae bacterium]
MKSIVVLIIAVAGLASVSCSSYTCPTYSKNISIKDSFEKKI